MSKKLAASDVLRQSVTYVVGALHVLGSASVFAAGSVRGSAGGVPAPASSVPALQTAPVPMTTVAPIADLVFTDVLVSSAGSFVSYPVTSTAPSIVVGNTGGCKSSYTFALQFSIKNLGPSDYVAPKVNAIPTLQVMIVDDMQAGKWTGSENIASLPKSNFPRAVSMDATVTPGRYTLIASIAGEAPSYNHQLRWPLEIKCNNRATAPAPMTSLPAPSSPSPVPAPALNAPGTGGFGSKRPVITVSTKEISSPKGVVLQSTSSLPGAIRTGEITMTGLLPAIIRTGAIEMTGIALPGVIRTGEITMTGLLPDSIRTGAIEMTGMRRDATVAPKAQEMSSLQINK